MKLTKAAKKEVLLNEDYQWNNKVILVAEDIELNFMYINEILESTGAIIIHVENGKKAVDLCLSNENIDLVLMDILMPVLNGYDATRQIKAKRSNLPVIAQTAYALTEDRGKAIAAGCDDFIAKPIGKNELLRKIDRFLNNSSLY
jgi:CheY-like chemotaxis protein